MIVLHWNKTHFLPGVIIPTANEGGHGPTRRGGVDCLTADITSLTVHNSQLCVGTDDGFVSVWSTDRALPIPDSQQRAVLDGQFQENQLFARLLWRAARGSPARKSRYALVLCGFWHGGVRAVRL